MTDSQDKPRAVVSTHLKTNERLNMNRRKFLLSSSFLLSATTVLGTSPLLAQTTPKGPDLLEALTPEELARIKDSIMSEDMQNFWGKGYSCAETGLMVALRFMKKPEDLVWTAGGFGGGMGQGDLCGFLTAGIMAIGLHAGTLKVTKNTAKTVCGQKVKGYWTWWTSMAPLHCSEIREGRQGYEVCQRLGKLAAAKLETLLKV